MRGGGTGGEGEGAGRWGKTAPNQPLILKRSIINTITKNCINIRECFVFVRFKNAFFREQNQFFAEKRVSKKKEKSPGHVA